MKVWLVKTDDIEFDMYQGAVIVAPTKEKAVKSAWATFTKNPINLGFFFFLYLTSIK